MSRFSGGPAQPVFGVDPATGNPVTPGSGLPSSLGQKTAANSTSMVLASDQGTITTALQGDVRAGALFAADHTLGTANTITAFTIPAGARGFRIINNAVGALRFNIDADPPAANTATSGTAVTVSSAFGAYNNIALSATEVRIFERGSVPTTLRVNSSTAAATFTIGFF